MTRKKPKTTFSWLNPKLEVRPAPKYGKGERGVFAGENIKNGQIIKVFSGEVISFDECTRRIEKGELVPDDPLQIGKKLYLQLDYISYMFNHSCNPNAGFRKKSELFALRNIKKGEEITYDYSATVGPNITPSLWTMACKCGSKNCRKILGNILTIPKKTFVKYKKSGAFQDYMKLELKKVNKQKI